MPTVIISGDRLGLEILEALGISSERVMSVAINLKPNTAAEVVVTHSITTDGAARLVEHLKRYELIERKAARGGNAHSQ